MNNQEISQSPESKPRFYYWYVIVVAVLLVITIMYGTRFSFGVFFSPMIREFNWAHALTAGAFSL